MKNSQSDAQIDDHEHFHDALDNFPIFDCDETFPQQIESSNGEVSISDKPLPGSTLRRRRSASHRKYNGEDSIDPPKVRSLVDSDNSLNSREKKSRLSRNANDNEMKYSERSEHSTVTDVNSENKRDELVRIESGSRERRDGSNSSFLLALVGVIVKAISLQIYLLVKLVILQIYLLVKLVKFPVCIVYYWYMLVFNPLGLLRRFRRCIFRRVKGVWSLVFRSVSPFVWEWLKEHRAVWSLVLKCGWGLLWSAYVCAVLVGLLLTAFVVGGIFVHVVVEDPVRVRRSLNFDYTEKSPVAYVPVVTNLESSHDVYIGEKAEVWKYSGSRVIPVKHKLKVTVSLTLPETDYNQNLGIFQVRVDFLSADGKTLASSRRPCMLHYKSQPIRLLLTFLKVAPILTGYTSETQDLKINFRGFTEGSRPTACLRVVIEQRAQYLPGAGIPEIYAASVALESELPLLKRVLWSWKKTLFVWISMFIFTLELVFSLLCCRPVIIPKIKLKRAANGDARRNELERPGRS